MGAALRLLCSQGASYRTLVLVCTLVSGAGPHLHHRDLKVPGDVRKRDLPQQFPGRR